MSGVDLPGSADLPGGRRLRKGAAGAVTAWVRGLGGVVPPEAGEVVDGVPAAGGTPLVLVEDGPGGPRVLGVIRLEDVVEDGVRERSAELRRTGIRTVVITGDDERTARAIAAEAGIDDVLAEATPEDELALIRREQGGWPAGREDRRTSRWTGSSAGAGVPDDHRHGGGEPLVPLSRRSFPPRGAGPGGSCSPWTARSWP